VSALALDGKPRRSCTRRPLPGERERFRDHRRQPPGGLPLAGQAAVAHIGGSVQRADNGACAASAEAQGGARMVSSMSPIGPFADFQDPLTNVCLLGKGDITIRPKE
jgi:hypothetical protein